MVNYYFGVEMFLSKREWLCCLVSGIIGFSLGEAKIPVIRFLVGIFGSEEERLLQDYEEMKIEAERDSLLKISQSWKVQRDSFLRRWEIEKDSLLRFEQRKATLCIRREIKRAKENPCESTIYYYRGNLGRGTNWAIGSTKCLEGFYVPAYKEDIPVSLLDEGWLKMYFFYRSTITEREVTQVNGVCE